MFNIKVFFRRKIHVLVITLIIVAFIHLTSQKTDNLSSSSTTNQKHSEENVIQGARPAHDPPELEVLEPQSPEDLNSNTGLDRSTYLSIKDYSFFFKNLDKYALKSPSIKDVYKTNKAAEKFSNDDSFLFSKEYLENVLDIPDSTFRELKDSHKRYVNEEITRATKHLSTFGNVLTTDIEWKEYAGSSGYVIVGGGQYSWLAYLVIRQIRATGANLPIELFIANENEYEKDFCEILLPKYNARCNLFNTELSSELKKKFGMGGFQYKMLAILSSKFENVIYLDSDNFPTKDVDYIVDSELYKEKGLIIWPDAWARTTNPKYYDIAGIEVKEKKIRFSNYDKKRAEKEGKSDSLDLSDYSFQNSAYHDFEGTLPNPSSEAGMLIINKTSHLKTLLLSLYYNVFGPNFYYPLLTQGSAGEGDKETFIAAAHVMKEPYFQILKQFKWTGYFSEENNEFRSKALGHYDPIQSLDQSNKDSSIVFMHLSYPKYYPNWLADNHDLIYEGLGNHIRMYADIYDNVGYDFDLRVLQFFTQGICPNYYDEEGDAIDGQNDVTRKTDYMGNFLSYVRNDELTEADRCLKIFIPHLRWLKETSKYPRLN
ncbi:uncharacterized protein PRCAT00000138001 [Priceomyces carsonii]|uniref:uncharacterized protein n=1 Tax=Priceomyces carsonii TaxID=28549 RepID=UPI002ED9C43C|nr:unnamed protein product [Priceomyces carsonii]